MRVTSLSELTILIRCMVGYYLFVAAVGLLRIVTFAMPADHPGRIYMTGRIGEGAERIRIGLSEKAATRYIASRRPL